MFQWLRTRRVHLRDVVITAVVLGGLGVLALTQFPSTSTAPRRPGPPVSGNVQPLAETLVSPTTDLNERMRRFPEVLQYAEFEIPGGISAASSATLLNFLEYQVLVKTVRVESLFLLLEGRRTESLVLLSAVHYLGQLMSEDRASIAGITGIALMIIAEGGLRIQALNTWESPADRKQMWGALEDLDARTPPPQWRAYTRDAGLLHRFMFSENLREMFARHETVYAKFQLLRAAVAALDRMASTGSWPASPADFGPFLPSGPSLDPFEKAPVPYRYAPAGATDFVLWSVGPDATDNLAAVQYDPTNGTFSPGDLIVEVPRTRTYDFPSSGTAVTAGELLSRFPSGVGPDPFADTRGRALGVSAHTTATVVYSFGPDTDESRTGSTALPDTPEMQYDPTNGVVSEGDLLRVWTH